MLAFFWPDKALVCAMLMIMLVLIRERCVAETSNGVYELFMAVDHAVLYNEKLNAICSFCISAPTTP